MTIHAQTEAPGNTEEILATLTNPNFIAYVTQQIGGELENTQIKGETAKDFTLTTTRKLPTDRFPDIAKKILGKSMTINQTEIWEHPNTNNTRNANITIKISNAPITVKGNITLQPKNTQTTQITLNGEISSNIPFMGKKIAETAKPFLEKALKLQITYLKQWQEQNPTS